MTAWGRAHRRDRVVLAALSAAAFFGFANVAGAASVTPESLAWVQLTGEGAEARSVAPPGESCPLAQVDGRPVPLARRAAPDERFPEVCALALPPGVDRLSVRGYSLPVPKAIVRRIVVFGDSGCRIKGAAVQACNDPAAWPFAQVAKLAAARHPDLVIHLGDYYYRETPCPILDAGCAGSPSGDRWPAWKADFFAPAAPLFRAAPFVFVRGNHESCTRGGAGWFRLLDASATAKTCPAQASPWRASLGELSLFVLDSADAEDTTAPPDRVAAFGHELDALQPALGRDRGWLVTHRPVWGLTPVLRFGPKALDVALNATEQAAVRGRDLSSVMLALSGHVHHFSSFDFGASRPAQLVVGTGGDVGQPADSPRITQDRVWLDGLPAKRTEFDRFGYMVLDRLANDGSAWRGVFYDAGDRPVVICNLTGQRLSCTPAATSP